MKILFKDNNVQEIEFEESILSNNQMLENLYKLLDRIENKPKENLTKITLEEDTKDFSHNSILIQDSIRASQRLPNSSDVSNTYTNDNLIDLNNYKMQSPMISDHFRCSCCGQSLFIKVIDENSEVLLIRDITSEDEHTKLYSVINKESIDFKNYKFGDIINTEEEMVLINNENSIGKCPFCENEDPISKWIEVYEHPKEYFEYDYICDVCGSEMTFQISHDNGSVKNILICELCGYTKESKN